MDALGETGGMPHPVDRQVVDGNHRKGVDEPAAVLVGEVPPTPGEALVDTGHHLSPHGPLRAALLTFAQTPLGTGQGLLIPANEPRALPRLLLRPPSTHLPTPPHTPL